MKGKITIDGDGERLHITGEARFNHEGEIYEAIRALSLSLDIDSPAKWADLVCYCVPRLGNVGRESKSIKIKIPNVEENEDGRND